jgi:DNA-binding Lrp family transcriptional regulator
MVDMYVLAICNFGRSESITSKLHEINEVSEIHRLYGCFDILVKMSGSSTKELENIYSKIKCMDGIKNASTLIGFGKHSSQ